jgi:hypothetical protein
MRIFGTEMPSSFPGRVGRPRLVDCTNSLKTEKLLTHSTWLILLLQTSKESSSETISIEK